MKVSDEHMINEARRVRRLERRRDSLDRKMEELWYRSDEVRRYLAYKTLRDETRDAEKHAVSDLGRTAAWLASECVAAGEGVSE